MTPGRLNEIKARVDAATDAPWLVNLESSQIRHETNWHDFAICEMSSESSENAEFIAHARQDIPDLLEYIAKLQAEIKELEDNCNCEGYS